MTCREIGSIGGRADAKETSMLHIYESQLRKWLRAPEVISRHRWTLPLTGFSRSKERTPAPWNGPEQRARLITPNMSWLSPWPLPPHPASALLSSFPLYAFAIPSYQSPFPFQKTCPCLLCLLQHDDPPESSSYLTITGSWRPPASSWLHTSTWLPFTDTQEPAELPAAVIRWRLNFIFASKATLQPAFRH